MLVIITHILFYIHVEKVYTHTTVKSNEIRKMLHNTIRENYVTEYKLIWNLQGEKPLGKRWITNFYYNKIKFN